MFNCGFKYFDINVNNTLTIVFVINISLYYDLTHSSNAIATFLADNFFFLQQFSLKFKYLATQRTNKSKTLLLDISIAM